MAPRCTLRRDAAPREPSLLVRQRAHRRERGRVGHGTEGDAAPPLRLLARPDSRTRRSDRGRGDRPHEPLRQPAPFPEWAKAPGAGAAARGSLYVSPPLAAWAAGRIALLGDAARGMLPN